MGSDDFFVGGVENGTLLFFVLGTDRLGDQFFELLFSLVIEVLFVFKRDFEIALKLDKHAFDLLFGKISFRRLLVTHSFKFSSL